MTTLLSRRALAGAAALPLLSLAGLALAGSARAQSSAESTFERVRRTKVLRIAALPGELPYFTKDIAGAKTAGVVLVLNRKTDVGVSGNTGWESGTYKATVKGAVVETGKFLSVSRKKEGKTWITGSSPEKYYPSPASLANSPFTARAHPASLRSRVAWLIAGLKRCSSRQLSANFAGSG